MAISMQGIPLVELCTGLLSLYAALVFGPTAMLVAALVLIGFLIVLTGIDIDTCLLPDSLTLPLLWLGLLVNLAGSFLYSGKRRDRRRHGVPVPLEHLLGV